MTKRQKAREKKKKARSTNAQRKTRYATPIKEKEAELARLTKAAQEGPKTDRYLTPTPVYNRVEDSRSYESRLRELRGTGPTSFDEGRTSRLGAALDEGIGGSDGEVTEERPYYVCRGYKFYRGEFARAAIPGIVNQLQGRESGNVDLKEGFKVYIDHPYVDRV